MFIGALARTCGLWVIAVADETFMSVFAQSRLGLVLASTSVEETANFGFTRRGLEMLPENVVACLGDKRTGQCAVCCHLTWLAACM